MRVYFLLFVFFVTLSATSHAQETSLACLQAKAMQKKLSSAVIQWQPIEDLLKGDAITLMLRNTFEAAIRHEEALIALAEQQKIVFAALRPYFLQPDAAYQKFFDDLNRYDRQVQEQCNREQMAIPFDQASAFNPPLKTMPSITAMQQILQKSPEYLGKIRLAPPEGGIPLSQKVLTTFLNSIYVAEQAAIQRAQLAQSLKSLMALTESSVTANLQSMAQAGLTLEDMQRHAPSCFQSKTPDTSSVFSKKFSSGVITLLKRPLPYDSSGIYEHLACASGIQNTAWLQPKNQPEMVKAILNNHSKSYDKTTTDWMQFEQKIQRLDYDLQRKQRILVRAEKAAAENPALKKNAFFVSALNDQRKAVETTRKNLAAMQADYDKMAPASVAKTKAEQEKIETFLMTLQQAGLENLSTAPPTLAERKAALKKMNVPMPAKATYADETPAILDGEITFARSYAAKAKQFLDYYSQNRAYIFNPRVLQISCAITTKMAQKQKELSTICENPKPRSPKPQRP